MILVEVFLYFLRLGFVGFGGPLSIIAILQKELVEERAWISEKEFKQVFALVKSMPGPIAFQLCVFLGGRKAGFLGSMLAAIGFVVPAFLLMIIFGYYYQSYAAISEVQGFLIGMQAAAVLTILVGLRPLFIPYLRRGKFWLLMALGAFSFYVALLPEPILILGGAALWAMLSRVGKSKNLPAIFLSPKMLAMKNLLLVCFKAGAIVFGTGLAIVPLLELDFVERLGWMTHGQFMDALAMGQVTPGPVVITATFIGFQKLGMLGAVGATVAVFLPSFFHMVTWFPRALVFLSRQSWIEDFTFAATSIIIGTLLVTITRMIDPWRATPFAFVVFGFCLVVWLKFRVPPWALIPLGGFLGLVGQLIHF